MLDTEVVGDGQVGDTCGIPVLRTSHHGAAIWSSHACNDRQCPRCCDRGYVVVEAGKILHGLRQSIMGLAETGQAYSRGRPLQIVTWIYSPREDAHHDTPQAYDRDRKKMAERLKAAGIIMGWSVSHPYRGEHAPDASGEDIRASLDRTTQSYHWHGVGLAYWTTPTPPDGGYYLRIKSVGKVAPDRRPDKLQGLWGYCHKYARYILNHAGSPPGRQIVTRFGRLPCPRSKDERPEAIRLWQHPTTGTVYTLSSAIPISYSDPDRKAKLQAIWNDPRRSWVEENHDLIKDDMAAIALSGRTPELGERVGSRPENLYRDIGPDIRYYPLSAVEIDPDDSPGLAWDARLMSLLSDCRRQSSSKKNNEAPQAVAGSAPGPNPDIPGGL